MPPMVHNKRIKASRTATRCASGYTGSVAGAGTARASGGRTERIDRSSVQRSHVPMTDTTVGYFAVEFADKAPLSVTEMIMIRALISSHNEITMNIRRQTEDPNDVRMTENEHLEQAQQETQAWIAVHFPPEFGIKFRFAFGAPQNPFGPS
jgi:hypothetical protein